MDTTPENIKMCLKAEEIQNKWIPRVGDLAWKGKDYLMISDACGFITEMNTEIGNKIWLPHQCQMQDMVFDNRNHSHIYYIHIFRNWIVEEKTLKSHKAQNYSMEQLWEAFVMKELWQKSWDGEEWKSDK